MKKFRYILCCLLFMLCGCQKVEETPENEEFVYVLFVAPLENHPIWLRSAQGLFDACEEKGYYCDWVGPNTIDTATMNAILEKGIIEQADAIITQGVVEEELVKQATEHDIAVILVDQDMPQSTRNAYFGKNFAHQAELLLEDVETRMGKEEPLVMAIQVAEESFPIAKQQIEEIKKVFAQHPGGFEIVDVTSSKSDKVRARKEWEESFTQHETINIAISLASESVESCYESATELGMESDMLIYGVDDLEPTVALLKEGKITGSIVTPFYDYGYETIQYLDSYWKDAASQEQKIFDVEIEMLTKEETKDIEYE